MGKKRIVKTEGTRVDKSLRDRAVARTPKKKLVTGVFHVQSTFNDTKALLMSPSLRVYSAQCLSSCCRYSCTVIKFGDAR